MRNKIMLAVLLLTTGSSMAAATPRYSALEYNCQTIQSLIEQHGAAIFRYPSPRKPGLTLYDRYVRNRSYCTSYQVTERVLIPSSDTDRCPVRHCKTAECDPGWAMCY